MKGTIAVTCLIDVFELSIPRHSSCGTVEILKNRFATGGKEKLSGFIFVTSDELMAWDSLNRNSSFQYKFVFITSRSAMNYIERCK